MNTKQTFPSCSGTGVFVFPPFHSQLFINHHLEFCYQINPDIFFSKILHTQLTNIPSNCTAFKLFCFRLGQGMFTLVGVEGADPCLRFVLIYLDFSNQKEIVQENYLID